MNNTSHNQGQQLCWARDWLTAEPDIEQVPLALVGPGEPLRSKGQSKAHTRLLQETPVEMVPIIVHHATMQVIDGMHRLAAAHHRHQDTIAVRFFNGTAEEAFNLAVVANTAHGLPLTLKDRRAAAARILGMYPDCSDRMIAATAGLSDHTVAVIRRRCSSAQIARLNARRGRDGKARPLNSRGGRQAAAALIQADRSRSVREVARQAGISVGTVHDVRDRLARGVSPLVSPVRGTSLNVHVARSQAALKRLWNDPDLRSHETSKTMLQLLTHSLRTAADAQAACKNAPEHCRDTVADLAAATGDTWTRLAHELRSRTHTG